MSSDHDLGVVLVVGGCGYLGSHLVQMLTKDAACSAVHIVSRNPKQNLHQDATYHSGDIANLEEITTLLDKIQPRFIFHTASPKYTEPESLLRRTNLTGTNAILTAAAACPSVRAVVYTSTDSAIVQARGIKLTEAAAQLHTESSRVNPYAKTKAIADAAVQAANGPNLATAVIRIGSLYGEDDDNLMGSLMNAIKKDQHRMQVGNNVPRFEFIYVERACAAHVLAALALLSEPETAQRVAGEAFFVSDDVSLPYFDFARKVYAFAGHPVAESEIKIVPYWLALGFAILGEWVLWALTFGTKTPDLPSLGVEYLNGGCEFDISKAKERLGYRPVEDQDAVLKKVAEIEAKRCGV